jgi:hypothetical protein
MPAFRRNIMSPSSALKMNRVWFSETFASTDDSTWLQNPEKHHHPHHREDLRCHIMNAHSTPQGRNSIMLQMHVLFSGNKVSVPFR